MTLCHSYLSSPASVVLSGRGGGGCCHIKMAEALQLQHTDSTQNKTKLCTKQSLNAVLNVYNLILTG